MARILVLQHSDVGGPGRLGTALRDNAYGLEVRRPDLSTDKGGTPVPASMEGFGGLVVLGGPQNADDPHPWINAELQLIREAHAAELPVLGICLGSQLIAKALGGTVGPMEGSPEVGFERVDLPVPAQTHTMMAGVPWSGRWFQSHSQEVKGLPEGATVLATSERCKVQAFAVGLRTYGVQFHIEADAPMLMQIAKADHDQLAAAGLTSESLAEQAQEHYPRYALMADRLCANLISYAFAYGRLRSA